MNFEEYRKLDENFRIAMEMYSKYVYSGKDYILNYSESCYCLSEKYLDAMKEKANQDKNFCELAGSYLQGNGKTLLLKEILYSIPLYCEDTILNQHNGLSFIDSISFHYNRKLNSFWYYDYSKNDNQFYKIID